MAGLTRVYILSEESRARATAWAERLGHEVVDLTAVTPTPEEEALIDELNGVTASPTDASAGGRLSSGRGPRC